jgi:hypothetical protein
MAIRTMYVKVAQDNTEDNRPNYLPYVGAGLGLAALGGAAYWGNEYNAIDAQNADSAHQSAIFDQMYGPQSHANLIQHTNHALDPHGALATAHDGANEFLKYVPTESPTLSDDQIIPKDMSASLKVYTPPPFDDIPSVAGTGSEGAWGLKHIK